MIFRQLLHFDPVGASYVLGCGGHGVCAIVDPVSTLGTYTAVAEVTGMRIKYVIDTHVHADHLSGGRDLAREVGAEYLLHESVAWNGAQRIADGDALELGNVILKVLHTPGHTPEHVSLLVIDKTRGNDPWAALTGHTLMVGDMGRTELATTAADGAEHLWASAKRLRALADHVEVWPGAFSGSVCGRGLSGKPSSTIGFERRFNRTFRIMDRAEFVNAMMRDTPPAPPRAREIRAINLGS
jgi:glyoxylase-like metal-dependent hydrolase (beta-lactamase superfamily II)